MISIRTRSTGTVHTSAKARLTRIQIHIRILDPDRNQNLIVCSVAHCQPSLEISWKSVWIFFAQSCKQTDKQTNNDDYITSLAEVKMSLWWCSIAM